MRVYKGGEGRRGDFYKGLFWKIVSKSYFVENKSINCEI
jgi:hypothetical protein